MKVSVYGTGYVGLVSGVCLAKLGHDVLCLDIDEQKIARLRQGISPIHERGLNDLLKSVLDKQQISFTTDYQHAVTHASLHIIAVGTPCGEDGNADMQYVYQVAESIAALNQQDLIIVNKSTVPVGSAEKVAAIVEASRKRLNQSYQFSVVSNPEFLREGVAVNDFLNPDRVIVGCSDKRSEKAMKALYQPLTDQGIPLIIMNQQSAELTKYAANGLLATKISFMNEISQLAERVGADIEQISQGISLDHRIGRYYNNAGCGYGGSCFPKDIKALKYTLDINDNPGYLINAVDRVNEKQRHWLARQVISSLGEDLSETVIGLWGLAFKPETDDIRQAPSLYFIDEMLKRGAKIYAYDEVARENVQKRYGNHANIHFAQSAEKVLQSCDCLVIATEWDEFIQFDRNKLRQHLTNKLIIDGRNIYPLIEMKQLGLNYISVGRPVVMQAAEQELTASSNITEDVIND